MDHTSHTERGALEYYASGKGEADALNFNQIQRSRTKGAMISKVRIGFGNVQPSVLPAVCGIYRKVFHGKE